MGLSVGRGSCLRSGKGRSGKSRSDKRRSGKRRNAEDLIFLNLTNNFLIKGSAQLPTSNQNSGSYLLKSIKLTRVWCC